MKKYISTLLCKYSQNTFLEKHLWVTASVYQKVNTAMLAGIHLFRVKIEKLEQGVKYVRR